MEWYRWHNGTTTDAKWRAIGRRTGQPTCAVLAVWAALCENANASPNRGTLANWCTEDVAAVLDMETEDVARIIDAMQGKVLDGERLTGWEKRNPKREDTTALERKQRQRAKVSRSVTQSHAGHAASRPIEREEEEEEEVEKEITTSSVLKLHARDAREDQVNEVIRLANRGMTENPAIGDACNPIPTGHGSRQTVLDWLSDGIPAEMIGATVYERAQQYKPDGRRRQITTMRYFDGAVRDAHERHQAKHTEVPDGPDHGATAQGGGPAQSAGRAVVGNPHRGPWIYD